MPGEQQYDGKKEVQEIIKGKIDNLEKGGKFDKERALELAADLGDLARAAREAERAFGEKSLKPKERAEAEKVMKREIGEALTALRDMLRDYDDKTPELIETARGKIEELGAIAKKGPNAYPKPALFGLLGESQFDQWMKELDKNPREVLKAVASFGEKTADRVATEGAAKAAKLEGVRVASKGNILADYLSGTATEKRLSEYELGHND